MAIMTRLLGSINPAEWTMTLDDAAAPNYELLSVTCVNPTTKIARGVLSNAATGAVIYTMDTQPGQTRTVDINALVGPPVIIQRIGASWRYNGMDTALMLVEP